jgi:predicted permease
MSQLTQHLRYAFRTLVRTPTFTAVALLTLALGIGANAAIFSVVNGVLLRPLPFPNPDAIYQLVRHYPGQGDANSLSIRRYLDARGANRAFADLTAYEPIASGFNLSGEGRPERFTGVRVSREFFRVFGTQPAIGRGISAEDELPGAAKVAILSDALWRQRFGADRGIVGRALPLNGEPYTVVGVMPPSFDFPPRIQLWTALTLAPGGANRDSANYLMIVGRLPPGTTAAHAASATRLIGQRYRQANPDEVDAKESLKIVPLHEELYGRLRPALLVLLGAVLLVVLIACVNVANLQLVRAATRRREIALRTALGARAGRIVGQLLTESVLLALAGGALGLLVGFLILKPLIALSPVDALGLTGQAQIPHLGIDGRVLAFTFGLSLLAGLLFGLLPALQAARPDLREPLQEGNARSVGAGGARGVVARRILVVCEVALALVLVTGAALLVKSFGGLIGRDPGFRPQGVLTMKLSLPEERYGTAPALDRFGRQLVEAARGLPGVQSAAVAPSLPMEIGPDLDYYVVGKWPGGKSQEGTGDAQYRPVAGSYFQTLGIRLVRGRLLADSDGPGGEPVVVINETIAKRFWPTGDPVGQQIQIGGTAFSDLADAHPRRIVGVVKNVHETGLERKPPEIVYVPLGQVPNALTTLFVRLLPLSIVVRTAGEPAALTHSLEQKVWSVDPQQPITSSETLQKIVDRSLGTHRFNMLLMMGLATLAVVLAAVGIYGVLSYLVGERTREVGVRMALGATAKQVLWMVVGQGLPPVAIGVALGLAGAFGLTRLLKSLLVGVSSTDPTVFALTPVVLAAVAILASVFPARRASQLDPLVALRRE